MPMHEAYGSNNSTDRIESRQQTAERTGLEKAQQYNRANDALAALGHDVPTAENQAAIQAKIAEEAKNNVLEAHNDVSPELVQTNSELATVLTDTVRNNLTAANIPTSEYGVGVLDSQGQQPNERTAAAAQASSLLEGAVRLGLDATDPTKDGISRTGSNVIGRNTEIGGAQQGTPEEIADAKKRQEIVFAGLGLNQQMIDNTPEENWRAAESPQEGITRMESDYPTDLPGVFVRTTYDTKGSDSSREYSLVSAAQVPSQEAIAA